MSDDKKVLITVLDSAQRTIIGEQISAKSPEYISIKNPVVVNIVQQFDPVTRQPNGQMALQLLPVFFKEFLADKGADVVYNYPLSSTVIVDSGSPFDFKLISQYNSIFQAESRVPAGQVGSAEKKPVDTNSPVVKLFD